jgi:hypothetical protein
LELLFLDLVFVMARWLLALLWRFWGRGGLLVGVAGRRHRLYRSFFRAVSMVSAGKVVGGEWRVLVELVQRLRFRLGEADSSCGRLQVWRCSPGPVSGWYSFVVSGDGGGAAVVLFCGGVGLVLRAYIPVLVHVLVFPI